LLTWLLAPAVFAAVKLQVYTVNYPLAYFAERVGGDQVEVVFPVPADFDPAFWMPDTDTIAAYQGADLILLNGADYAKWLTKVSLPRSRLVDSSRGFKDDYIPVLDGVTHSHGQSGQHSHSGTAFTTWLDLRQALQQAEAVAAAIARKRPQAKGEIDANLEDLRGDLLAVDERIAEITAADPGRALLTSHLVYQYLARRYALNLESVMWEPDEVPSEAQWADFEQLLAKHPANWMLWEAMPRPENVERLRRLGVESIVFDPSANRPETGDFLSVMTENARNLEQAYR
jgi:zinc transport system substrate-binding protein